MPTTTAQHAGHAHLAFALTVQHAMPAAATDAACWSPLSVASALGLAASGARGATREELTALLLGDTDPADLASLLADATDLHGGRSQPVVGVSNTMWAREDIPVRPEFVATLRSWPNGALRDAPFRTDPDGARRLINSDVGDTTHGLIRELLGAGSIERDTAAVLVNALYLKVAWLNAFADRATVDEPFHGPGGDARVPTMKLDKRLDYAASDGWQAVTLPADGEVEGVVLLPDGALASAETALDAGTLAALLDARTAGRTIRLSLPRFRARARTPLTAVLADLGVRTLFGPHADFGGISTQPMAVSSVQHEAVLTIDERGLEGAAATAAVMRTLAMHRDLSEPIEVRVDRPFLFLVRHRPSGAIYFLARVVRP